LSLTIAEIEKLHSDIEKDWHFKPYERGLRSKHALEWIVEKPFINVFGYERYPDVYSKCASLMEGIIRSQAFFNGNKRTALAAAHHYMYKNGYNMIIPLQAVKFTVVILVCERINEECIAKWIRQHSCSSESIEEYYSKLNEYVLKPAEMVVNLYKSGQDKKADSIISDWFRYDMNPDYRMDIRKTASFLMGLIRRPPPPSPPPSPPTKPQ
jgi:death-on-curing family protein